MATALAVLGCAALFAVFGGLRLGARRRSDCSCGERDCLREAGNVRKVPLRHERGDPRRSE